MKCIPPPKAGSAIKSDSGRTNNYLGLTFNHDAISEGQAALAAQGTGTTGSRMANGSYAPHLALEKEIAEFFNRPTAIVFQPVIPLI